MLDGDICLAHIWGVAIFWFSDDWGFRHRVRLNLTDAWFELALGRFCLTIFKKGYGPFYE